MVLVPLQKICRRSVVLVEFDTGIPGGGGWDMMVVFERTESIVVLILVEELSVAGIDSNVVTSPFDLTTLAS